MTTDETMIFEMLYKKHKKLLLSKKECAFEINRSCSSLDRDRKNSVGMQYIKERLHSALDYDTPDEVYFKGVNNYKFDAMDMLLKVS